MSTLPTDPVLSAALSIIVKASTLVAIAAATQAWLQSRSSAAARHLVWTLAIVSMLALPILGLVLPEWPLVIWRGAPATASAAPEAPLVPQPGLLIERTAAGPPVVDLEAVAAPAVRVPAARIVLDVYAAGVIVMLMLLGVQWWNVRRLKRAASDMEDAEWRGLLADCAISMGVARPVRLLRSRERSMPIAVGIRRTAILVPSIADSWPTDRRRAVILHELAHVARRDCLTQTLAFAACTLYWFHPAVWWVARRLHVEREFACDDRVIAAGTTAREYASHLLDIAYAFGRERAPALAVSMARPRQLEARLLAATDAARNRSVPAVRVRIAATLLAAAVLLPLSSATTRVAAADRDTQSVASLETPEQGAMAPRRLKSIETLLTDSALSILRAAATALGVSQDQLPGTWEIRPGNADGAVQLRLVEINSSFGSQIPIARLEGLAPALLTGTGGPVQFRLRRDAGTFTFEGGVRNGVGAGTFSFASNPAFAAELAKRGLAAPTALEQYQLARHDIGYAFIDELNRQGYARPQTRDLVRAGQHGVDVPYLSEMGALGYRLGSLNPLIVLRDHGVGPGYIRGLAAEGYKDLPAEDLRQARDHGITPEFVRAMREAGYRGLAMERLINARDHGVNAEFVSDLAEAGHRTLALDEVIRVRDHGVDREYLRAMGDAGYGSLSIDQLINARDHGVSVEFVREMGALGYAGLPIDGLVRLRDHGVDPQYVQGLKSLGYERLPVDDLVTLRDHGLSTDRIRAANTRAGKRLPVDLLKALASGGFR